MNIQSIKFSRVKLHVRKHSPEILLVGGIAGVVAGTVLACRATLKAPRVLKEYEWTMEQLKREANTETDPEEVEKYERFQVIATAEFIRNMAVMYGPAVVLSVLGIGMLVGSNRILNKRNAALVSAFKLVDEGFKKYRGRVIDELGPEMDDYFRFQEPSDKKLSVVEKKGKKPFKPDPEQADLPGEVYDVSMYGRWFDESCPAWRTDQSMNHFFLKAQQNWANDKLQMEGHLFLNEVYDMIGVPRSKEGAIVGWVANNGDGFVDFGVFDPVNRSVINRYTKDGVLLDFNVDGIIWDLI